MSQTRILIVDDEPGMLRTVERIVAPHYAVATARTPREALDQLAENCAAPGPISTRSS